MLVALDMREIEAGRNGVRTVLSAACQIEAAWLEEVHPARIEQRQVTEWNSQSLAVEASAVAYYDGMEYQRRVLPASSAAVT